MADLERTSESSSLTTSGPPSEEFVQLFTRYQRRLYLFILAQVANPVDAEEILQETNVVIWSKYQKFRAGSNFFAWACQIARYEVLKDRERRRKDRHCFSEEFIRQIAEDTLQSVDDLERRRKALVECLGKLSSKDRKLIQRRYAPGESGISVARELGRPTNSVYQSLGRIRRALWECIHRRLAAEAGS